MNVKLLRKVAKHILEVPERLDMSEPILAVEPGEAYRADRVTFDAPACGTVGCIAGWAVILAGHWEPRQSCSWYGVDPMARDVLDLDGVPAFHLFHVSQWPTAFRRRYHAAKTARGLARITVARIEHFIRTKGRE